MNTWSIPAKTFLVGEYAALKGHPALLLTTTPCFEIREVNEPGLHGIHPDSPAGRWWQCMNIKNFGLEWFDPYNGLGGMGASGAQFVGVYQACAAYKKSDYQQKAMLNDYHTLLKMDDSGILPSGYDVLAQQLHSCIYINADQNGHIYPWPFSDLAFILVHSGQKIQTHTHLQSLVLNETCDHLAELVMETRQAFETQNSLALIQMVQQYQETLTQAGWAAPHSLQSIQDLYNISQAKAIKGCGALGADVILLLVKKENLENEIRSLTDAHWRVLATSQNLYIPRVS